MLLLTWSKQVLKTCLASLRREHRDRFRAPQVYAVHDVFKSHEIESNAVQQDDLEQLPQAFHPKEFCQVLAAWGSRIRA